MQDTAKETLIDLLIERAKECARAEDDVQNLKHDVEMTSTRSYRGRAARHMLPQAELDLQVARDRLAIAKGHVQKICGE